MDQKTNFQLHVLGSSYEKKSETSNLLQQLDTKNLESMRWYLKRLSQRAEEEQMPNADVFANEVKLAEKSISELIEVLNNK